MLQLPRLAHHRGLAEAFHLLARDAERGHGPGGQQPSEFLALGDQFAEVLGEAAGEGVLDDRAGNGAADRPRQVAAHLTPGLVEDDHDLADDGCHGANPSLPLGLPASPAARHGR